MITLDTDAWEDDPSMAVGILLQVEGDFVIDASGAAAIPTQVAQILLSARETAKSRGSKFTLSTPSNAAKESLATLGLNVLLEETS